MKTYKKTNYFIIKDSKTISEKIIHLYELQYQKRNKIISTNADSFYICIYIGTNTIFLDSKQFQHKSMRQQEYKKFCELLFSIKGKTFNECAKLKLNIES